MREAGKEQPSPPLSRRLEPNPTAPDRLQSLEISGQNESVTQQIAQSVIRGPERC
jgi:hypothetical protein